MGWENDCHSLVKRLISLLAKRVFYIKADITAAGDTPAIYADEDQHSLYPQLVRDAVHWTRSCACTVIFIMAVSVNVDIQSFPDRNHSRGRVNSCKQNIPRLKRDDQSNLQVGNTPRQKHYLEK